MCETFLDSSQYSLVRIFGNSNIFFWRSTFFLFLSSSIIAILFLSSFLFNNCSRRCCDFFFFEEEKEEEICDDNKGGDNGGDGAFFNIAENDFHFEYLFLMMKYIEKLVTQGRNIHWIDVRSGF